MAVRRRGTKWTVKVYDPGAPGKQRWIGSFDTEAEAVDAERAATLGIAPSARARTIRDWSMVWLHDYARPAPATQRTYRYAVERIVKDAGDVLLSRVDRPAARRLAAEWPNNTTRVARTMFGDAQRDGLIPSNRSPTCGSRRRRAARISTRSPRTRSLRSLTPPSARSATTACSSAHC
jgi:hypothetical protein